MKDAQSLLKHILETWGHTDGYLISPEMSAALTDAEDFTNKEKN